MIQDIFPNRLDNQYVECSPQDNDVIFFFEGSSLLAKYIKEDTLTYPLYKQFIQGIKTGISKDSVDNYSFTYLLSVDDTKYFLAQRKGELLRGQYAGEMADSKVHNEYTSVVEGFSFVGVDSFRKAKPKATAFAAITAYLVFTCAFLCITARTACVRR